MRVPYQIQAGRGNIVGRHRRVSPYITKEDESRRSYSRENIVTTVNLNE